MGDSALFFLFFSTIIFIIRRFIFRTLFFSVSAYYHIYLPVLSWKIISKMQALYWHPVCESVLTLSLITPGWELDPSQHAGGWPLLSLQEAGPLSACCLVATGQHQCHHFIITQADSWTSLSKQEALSQSALHLHFNPTARLKEGPLSPDLWNGDICAQAQAQSQSLDNLTDSQGIRQSVSQKMWSNVQRLGLNTSPNL